MRTTEYHQLQDNTTLATCTERTDLQLILEGKVECHRRVVWKTTGVMDAGQTSIETTVQLCLIAEENGDHHGSRDWSRYMKDEKRTFTGLTVNLRGVKQDDHEVDMLPTSMRRVPEVLFKYNQ